MAFKIAQGFVYLVPFAVVIVTPATLFPFIVGKYVWFRSCIDLALIFFLLGMMLDPVRAREMTRRLADAFGKPLVIAVTVFVAAFELACLFGVNPAYSFWSNFERGEGGFQMLHLYVFFLLIILLFRTRRDIHRLLWVSVFSAAAMSAYGAASILKYVDLPVEIQQGPDAVREVVTGNGGPWFQTFQGFVGQSPAMPGYRFQGSIGSAPYTSAYMLFILAYAFMLWQDGARTKASRAFSALMAGILLLLAGIFFYSGTRGAFIGAATGLLVFFGYVAITIKKLRRWVIVFGALAVLFVVGMAVGLRDSPLLKTNVFLRIFDLSIFSHTFSNRIIMWQIAWEGFLRRPVFGWGPENFSAIFYEYFQPRYYVPGKVYEEWFDRAHSVFFDYLSETGIVGLLSYISIYVVYYWETVVRRPPEGSVWIRALMFAFPITYLIQGGVLFEVLVIYMNLILFLAVISWRIYFDQEAT